MFTALVGGQDLQLADSYDLAWKLHQEALARLHHALAEHLALLERIPIQARARPAAKVLALVASMSSCSPDAE